MIDLDAKGFKRSVNMWATNFYKSFFQKYFVVHEQSAVKNSFSTYVCYTLSRTVYFGWICICWNVEQIFQSKFIPKESSSFCTTSTSDGSKSRQKVKKKWQEREKTAFTFHFDGAQWSKLQQVVQLMKWMQSLLLALLKSKLHASWSTMQARIRLSN